MAKPSSNQNDHSRIENRSLKSRQFKGIRMRKWGKWVSEIRMPNSRDRIWLGSYDTPEKAARAFDFAVYCLRGSKADFNFPYSLPDIPDASSLSPQQIQAAAAKFAVEEMWLPSESNTADIPYPSSLSPLQIQDAAAKFAAEEIWLPFERNIPYPSSLTPLQIQTAAAKFTAEEIWLPSEDNAVDILYASSPCPPQIQAAAAKFAAEEFWLPSEDHALSSYYCSKAESGVEGQDISVKQGPTFWDSVLEDLDSNDSGSLQDFSPLDVYMEDYGFLFQPNEECGPGAF